jgi:hypothetical protein
MEPIIIKLTADEALLNAVEKLIGIFGFKSEEPIKKMAKKEITKAVETPITSQAVIQKTELTVEDVRAYARSFEDPQKIKKALDGFGVRSITLLPAEKYQEFIDTLKED